MQNEIIDLTSHNIHIEERLEILIGARTFSDLYNLIHSSINDLSFENASNHKIILDLKKEFHDDFKYYYKNYSDDDIYLLKHAFFYYREKIHKVKNMEFRKNPQDWHKPYINAIIKLKDLFKNFETDDIDHIQKSLQLMEGYIHQLSFHKRDVQKQNNHNTHYYLEQLENKSLSKKRLLDEFKQIDELLAVKHIDKVIILNTQ